MRFLFIIGTLVVLGCSIWVSFNHTLELFMEGGYKGGLEWGITIAAETAFLMGVLSRFNSRLRGTKPHAPATFLFLLGLGVVGWSNWNAGSAYGWEGILKGILVPFFIYGAEAVLAREYIEWRKEKDPTSVSENPVGMFDRIIDAINKKNTTSAPNTSDTNTSYADTSFDTSNSLTRNESTSSANTSHATSDTNTSFDTRNENTSGLFTSKVSTSYDTSYTHTSNDDTSEGNTSEMDTSLANSAFTSEANTSNVGTNETNTSEEDTSNPGTSELNTSDANTNTSVATSELNTSGSNTSDSNTSNVTSEIGTNETDTSESNTSDTTSKVVELAKHTSKRTTKRTSRRTTWTEEDYQRVKQIALQLREQDPKKELPGRPTLKEKAGCKENLARKVLEDLKEELKQSS